MPVTTITGMVRLLISLRRCQHFEAVDVRHDQIEHQQIDLIALDRGQRFGAVASRHHAMAVACQRCRQHAA